MDFKTATDALFEPISHIALARALGSSVPAIRQARLGSSAKAYRAPPKGWEEAVIAIAEERIRHYNELIGEINHQRQREGRS